jgi:hypothetical protein
LIAVDECLNISVAFGLYSSSINVEYHSIAKWHFYRKSSMKSSDGGIMQPLQ